MQQMVAELAHNQNVEGSSPSPATMMGKMLGSKIYYGICVCRDCGMPNDFKSFKRSEKRREKRIWRRFIGE